MHNQCECASSSGDRTYRCVGITVALSLEGMRLSFDDWQVVLAYRPGLPLTQRTVDHLLGATPIRKSKKTARGYRW
jgi:hypothetical protein